MPTTAKTVANVYTTNMQNLSTEETSWFVQDKLNELQAQLDRIPEEKKTAYRMAMKLCPELVSEDDKIAFLRCELFQATLAATRLVSYWTKRLEIFGPDKAFLPLTLDGALKDDGNAMKRGVVRMLPHPADAQGRPILFLDPSRQDRSQYSTESMARVVWYVLHVTLENENAQRFGLIVISNPKNAKRSQMDRALARYIVKNIRGCLPVRLTAIHICNPPPLFRWVHACFRLFLHHRVQKRIHVHAGSQEEILKQLKEFGLDKKVLPMEIGGDVQLDHAAWIQTRMEIEAAK
eukprot:Nitzschia sp. Nitz4//scaffold256_size27904//18611//19552//NITZ4_008171-RA/size27904-augustus-gene-0.4-mRNA-1//1//CDS//3329544417//2954//frame0